LDRKPYISSHKRKETDPMTSLLNAPAPAKTTTLEIKGLAYRVSPIDPGEEGTAAFRLDKVRGEGIYDVVRDHSGLVRCDCPSYVMTFASTASTCKHGRALVEAGMISAPSPVPVASAPVSPPVIEAGSTQNFRAEPKVSAYAPITRKDLARASYFGIKLPAGVPLAVEAPVEQLKVSAEQPLVVQSPTSAGWSEIEADDDDADDFGPEGDSWTAWPESLDRWDIEPEAIEPARSDIDLSGFVALAPAVVEAAPLDPFDDHWLGETAALLVTTSAIEDGDDGAYYRLDPEYREAFWGFVGSLGWPCATWPAWLALCEAGSPVSFPEPPEPRRTWSPRSEATPAEKAEAASLLRDDRPGAYFVIAPRRARSIHSTPSYRVEGIASEPHHAELAEAGGSCFARCHFA
jgi:hypothetical protein